MYKLYVIPGSHACRSAMLMLEHKRIPYRTVEFMTNHRIARFLDRTHPEPPLFPADPDERAAVEEAESWANGELQMTARLVLIPAVLRDRATFAKRAADGRLGPLLFRSDLVRRLTAPVLGMVFASGHGTDADVVAKLPAMLDRIDAWIAAGVIGGEQPNAADCMISRASR